MALLLKTNQKLLQRIGQALILLWKENKGNCWRTIIEETIGDIDFLCRTVVDIPLNELFPVGSRCDTTNITHVSADTDIYIEVTSMTGKLTEEKKDEKGMTKVEKKIHFFEKLFTESNLDHADVKDMDLKY